MILTVAPLFIFVQQNIIEAAFVTRNNLPQYATLKKYHSLEKKHVGNNAISLRQTLLSNKNIFCLYNSDRKNPKEKEETLNPLEKASLYTVEAFENVFGTKKESFKNINTTLPQGGINNDSSLTSLASEYFTALRLRAASILTDSLAENERETLLRSLKAIDKNEAEEITRQSIGEAVAAAVAEERAQEEAALARVQSDMKLLQNENIFGASKCLIDLGYKRIHVVSAKCLSAIPVWEKQRVYRHERAKVMAKELKKNKQVSLYGLITLCEDRKGQLRIIDGQHRVGMMTILQQEKEQGLEIELDEILVEVFPHSHLQDTSSSPSWQEFCGKVFVEINKAEPVKLIDLPGVAKTQEKRLINHVCESLRESYPDMFKPSQRCRSPHVNIDNLRNAIFTADLLDRRNLKTIEDLEAYIQDINSSLTNKYKSLPETDKQKPSIKKAIQYNFFLGLESSWLYN